jgi:predicted nucleic acid-binding protein
VAARKLVLILDTNVFVSGLVDLNVLSKANFLLTEDKALRKLMLVGQCAVVSPIELVGRL